jgi:hypothetical protein
MLALAKVRGEPKSDEKRFQSAGAPVRLYQGETLKEALAL